MSNFIISYDLKKAKNYPAVWNLLERSGAVRLLESLWLLATAVDITAVNSALRQAVDNDDAIVVVELKRGSDWATVNANPTGTAWLSGNIKRY
jgi:hypothetical protein